MKITLEPHAFSLVVKRDINDLPHWSTMQGMAADGPSLTEALEEEHREELAREDAKIKGS